MIQKKLSQAKQEAKAMAVELADQQSSWKTSERWEQVKEAYVGKEVKKGMRIIPQGYDRKKERR